MESFSTYPPTAFFPHNKTDNVNLTIVGDTFWGLRDLRVVYQVCEKSCLKCGVSGCLECRGLLMLTNGRCQGCPLGFGYDFGGSACRQCGVNCLNCMFGAANNNVFGGSCVMCSQAYFLIDGQCRPRTNIATDQLRGVLPANNPTLGNCSIVLPLSSSGNTNATPAASQFTLSSTTLTSTTAIPQPHYKKIVEFYLLRLGQWSTTDRLNVYLNDLLVLSKNYSDYGSVICSGVASVGGVVGGSGYVNQTDYLSYESIEFVDSNATLTVFFEFVSGTGNTINTVNTVNTVNTPNTTKYYGVSHLQIYP